MVSPKGKNTFAARVFMRPERNKDLGEKKVDALKKIFGQQVSYCTYNERQL